MVIEYRTRAVNSLTLIKINYQSARPPLAQGFSQLFWALPKAFPNL